MLLVRITLEAKSPFSPAYEDDICLQCPPHFPRNAWIFLCIVLTFVIGRNDSDLMILSRNLENIYGRFSDLESGLFGRFDQLIQAFLSRFEMRIDLEHSAKAERCRIFMSHKEITIREME